MSIIEMLKMKLLISKDEDGIKYILFSIFFLLITNGSGIMKQCSEYFNDIIYKKNKIILEGKYISHISSWRNRNTFLFTTNFKALWYFLDKNNYIDNSEISQLKEYENTREQFEDDNDSENNSAKNSANNNFNSFFVVNQKKGFKVYDNIYCSINFKNQEDEDRDDKSREIYSQTIEVTLYSYKSSLKDIKNFLDKISKEYLNSIENQRKNKKFIYSLNSKMEERFNWYECEFNSTKNFNNMYFESKDKLLEKIDFFVNNKEWYEKEGLPYTLGIALHGKPGTGKSSIIKCIANKLNRHIIEIPLNKIKTQEDFFECFFEKTYTKENYKKIGFDEKIFVFEDIDCMSDIVFERENKITGENILKEKNNENQDIDLINCLSTMVSDKNLKDKQNIVSFKKDENKITLSFILNILDGIFETSGRVFIITSNYYDRLDSALKRPGRIDINLEMKNCTKKTISEMVYNFYNSNISKEVLNKIPDFYFSPAEIINIRKESKNKKEFIATILKMCANKAQ